MKKTIMLIAGAVFLCAAVYIIADTTFSWSEPGQRGTLTYTSVKLVTPNIDNPDIDGGTINGATIADDNTFSVIIGGQNIQSGAISNSHIAPSAVNGTSIADGVISNDDIATNAAIAESKLNITGITTNLLFLVAGGGTNTLTWTNGVLKNVQ